MMSEEIQENIICINCNKSFKNKTGLGIHIKKCIEKQNIEIKYNCDYCNKDFSSKRNLHRHIDDKSCQGYITYLENIIIEKDKENFLLKNKLENTIKEKDEQICVLKNELKDKEEKIEKYKNNIQNMLNIGYNILIN
jgi:uncharacterized Zn-finger protein